jgi:hypothetical protein
MTKKNEAAEVAEAPVQAAEVAEAPVQAAEVKSTPKAPKVSVTVKYRDYAGNPTERTFSKEVHGDEFADLADEFKKTNAARIIE